MWRSPATNTEFRLRLRNLEQTLGEELGVEMRKSLEDRGIKY